jgi:trehalose synthase
MTATLTDLTVLPVAPDRFRELMPVDGWARVAGSLARGRELLEGRAVWNLSSRARSGGLAELLRSLTAYSRGAGVDARWEVIDAGDDFFRLAKLLHNNLHGRNGDGSYGAAERRLYEDSLDAATNLAELITPGDVVILHDPQTAGLVPAAKGAGAHVIWRCHVGLDAPNELARRAWRFLRPYLEHADAYVFSRLQFLWEGLDPAKAAVIRPSLNALSPKNQELHPTVVDAILAATGIQADGQAGDATFVCLDGSPGRVDCPSDVLETSRLPAIAPLLVQISHWNHLKDPTGVMEMFAGQVAPHASAHLLIAGPPTTAVADEPEGEAVFAETVAAWERLPDDVRARVHVARVPTDDPEEAAAIINALQRRAAVVMQKSRGEGFGMTVLEAMWKRRPVVCTRVGGLQDQVVDGVTGYLVDPGDERSAGRAILTLLDDPELCDRMGQAAHERVRSEFLLPREATDWSNLIARLLSPG